MYKRKQFHEKAILSLCSCQLILQNRFNNNISEFSQLNANAELSYKLNKHIKVQGGYVYGSVRKLNGAYRYRQQIYFGFLVKKRVNRFNFIYRNLIQEQNKITANSEKSNTPQFFDRNKLTVKYEVNKRIQFYLAEEINLPIYTKYMGFYISRSRSYAGMEYSLTKRDYIEGYFLFQRKYITTTGLPPRDFIYGLTYSHSF